MAELIMFPMTYASLEKEGRSVSLIWANSSKRIISITGDGPLSWLNTDATLAITRLISAGWVEDSRGKVEDE